jgi:hypothetical protein
MSNEHSSDDEQDIEILIEEVDENSPEEEKNDEVNEEIIEESKESSDSLTDTEITSLIDLYNETRKSKERAEIIDKFSEIIDNDNVKDLMIEIAKNDSYPLCRAKAVSNLGKWIENEEIQNIVIKSLNDISPKVRLWAVWTLRPTIHLKEIQETLINRIKFHENSRQIKLWMIRVLSDQIDDLFIQETFLYFFKLNPDMETKKLLLYYLLSKLENEDILFTISRNVQTEKNNEIRLEIVKKLVLVDEPDVKYILEKLSKTERNKEILELLKPQSST